MRVLPAEILDSITMMTGVGRTMIKAPEIKAPPTKTLAAHSDVICSGSTMSSGVLDIINNDY